MTGTLRVLVVDDSAVVRQGLLLLLGSEPGFTVEVASDPLIAEEKLARARPDVVVLDLEMPRMDGLTFLRRLMQAQPLPVVVCSGLAGPGSEAALRALEEGAVDVIAKPQLGVGDFLREQRARLVETLRGAASARIRPRPLADPLSAARTLAGRKPVSAPPRGSTPASSAPASSASASSASASSASVGHAPVGQVSVRELRPLAVTTDKVVAVGASTGGTEAVRELLVALPPDCPGLVIVQHMPEHFTAAFARRLDGLCRVEVKEAADGDWLREGRALIAPGNHHLLLHRSGGHYRVEVVQGPHVSRHRPSVDVLFHSVARAAGANALGMLLTGMGEDGADGLLALRRAGAATVAQDEASCVVFGMPREAISRGAAEEVLPLGRMAEAVQAFAHGRRPAGARTAR